MPSGTNTPPNEEPPSSCFSTRPEPVLTMERTHNPSSYLRPMGHSGDKKDEEEPHKNKRKTMDGLSEDEAIHNLYQVIRDHSTASKNQQESSSESTALLGYSSSHEDRTSRADRIGVEDAPLLPAKRQRYQRRNSFLIRRKGPGGEMMMPLDLFSLQNPSRVGRIVKPELPEVKFPLPPRRTANEPACNSDDTESSVSSDDDDEERRNGATSYCPTESRWGNASWANTDDTKWYSQLSRLAFDPSPIVPRPQSPDQVLLYASKNKEKEEDQDNTTPATMQSPAASASKKTVSSLAVLAASKSPSVSYPFLVEPGMASIEFESPRTPRLLSARAVLSTIHQKPQAAPSLEASGGEEEALVGKLEAATRMTTQEH